MEEYMNNCWAKSYCKQYQTEHCHEDCIAYNQLKFLYRTSGIPKKYQHLHHLELHRKDKQAQKGLEDFRDNIRENIEQGKGLILLSPNKGNGKTSWACIMMNEYIKEVALENNMRVRCKFISVPDFLQGLRDDFDREEKEMEKSKKHIRNSDLVVWDDIGTEKPSDWVRETLYNFINYRVSNNLSQIYTTNVEVDELEYNLGERIYSRMKGQCKGIRLLGPDQRRVNSG